MIITISVLAVTSFFIMFGAFYTFDLGPAVYFAPVVAATILVGLPAATLHVLTDESTSGAVQVGVLAVAFPLSIALVVAAMFSAAFVRNRVDTKRNLATQNGLAT